MPNVARPDRRVRRRPLAVLLVVLVLLPVAAAHGASAPAVRAFVDPELAGGVSGHDATAQLALLAWDDAAAQREEVLAHLEAGGVEHRAFSHLDMAVACVASSRDVDALATAPGAISVWGDEQLQPVLDTDAVVEVARREPTIGALTDLEVTGKDVGIVVLDTGVDATHPDLAYGTRTVLNTRVVLSHYEILGVGNDSCVPNVYQEEVEDSEIDSGQGTALAGVAAGDGSASDGAVVGMAPGADIVGVNVVSQVTPQYQQDVSMSLVRFVAGVNYALSETLMGGPTTGKVALIGWARDDLYDPYHPHYLAVRDLWDFGIVPVVPAGNDGSGGTSDCRAADTCHFNPLGTTDAAIAVGASNDDGTALESYSSRGDPNFRRARDRWVLYAPTLVAPGTNVLAPFRAGLAQVGTPAGSTPYPLQSSGTAAPAPSARYQALTGTSIAAARVAGAIALMQEAALEASGGCFLNSWQVRSILERTARPMDGYERHEVGAGALDVDAAVELAGEQLSYGGVNPWDCR